MNTKDIEKDIYSTFADIATAIGYSEIHGRVIAALLVSNRKLSLNELAKKTGYSLSTVSLSLDLLEFLGMIKKIKKVGDRKLYVELQGSLIEGLKKAFSIRIQKSINDTLNKFEQHKSYLKKNNSKESRNILNILKILEEEVQSIDNYINMLLELQLQ
jgi:DNA-binding transcriptional regulator GbsR (MarR family)